MPTDILCTSWRTSNTFSLYTHSIILETFWDAHSIGLYIHKKQKMMMMMTTMFSFNKSTSFLEIVSQTTAIARPNQYALDIYAGYISNFIGVEAR